MLDTDTKRRIDTARDILVGKVPDPKSQVEQITIALIYKFMDDMDAESEELGGRRKFFTSEFARYGWAKLMRSDLGGHEMLGLYAEGITKMPENPGIPLLFRDIFKNAYLPYRDPETLKAFLKIIDEFTYDHSERLGDAFEYLLSVLGSQGDAGQFRTPRHIIDFIVSVVDPKKNETVLDPACGTAGFLISAWKHILRCNSSTPKPSPLPSTSGRGAGGEGKIATGDLLTPDEKGRLAKNFKGYDISPDMVRLSLVNLYLHGFTAPSIYEYDTLTSEERWNEFADVILANPPFMSPKGGIKPHKRFSIQAKRSEVLFVDYMAEHLTPTGRAGIIVPEGIIFQSQTAYVELRKSLVENSLVAVVSLPAGCFNPYSGVKTSILFLDKSLARRSDSIAFFKVENDGFGLGAQRRAIEKNDLPQVQIELAAYLTALRRGDRAEALAKAGLSIPSTALIVPKSKIAANGDYNLSGERYREGAASNTTFPKVRLGDACERIMDGTHFSPKSTEQGEFRYITAKNIKEWGLALDDVTYLTKADHDEIYRRCPVKKGDVLYIKDGATTGVATINPLDEEFSLLSSVAVLRGKAGVLDNRFLVRYLNSPIGKRHMLGMMSGVAISRLTLTKLNDAEIPLPPLEVQKEIVAEIEGYQKVIDGARAVLDHYRPHIPIDPAWPMVELGEVIESKPKNGYSGSPVDHTTNVKVLSLSATTLGKMDLSKFKYLDEAIPLDSQCRCRRGDIYLQRGNTKELVGTAAIFDTDDEDYIYPDLMIRIRADESKIRSHYLLTVLQSSHVREFMTRNAVGAAGSMPKINQSIVERIPIPLPPLATQQAIVAEIEAEQALVAGNRELISRFEKKIQTTLARIWGEENTQP
jgi:type I restriction enzyme M protein